MAEFAHGILMEMYADREIPESEFEDALNKAFPGIGIKIKGYEVDEE
jgi:hypothetical protein